MSFLKPYFSLFFLGAILLGNAFAQEPNQKMNDVTFSAGEKPAGTNRSPASEEPDPTSENCKSEENCRLRQADAFQRASQAAKYLAYYMQMEKFKPDYREQIKKVVEKCLTNPDSCSGKEKEIVLGAAVQHNLGKEIRHMVLQNNTNMNNMKSLNTGADFLFNGKYWIQGSKAKELDTPYKLDPSQVGDSPISLLSKKEAREKEILGNDFLREYGIFLNTYAKTSGRYGDGSADKSRWHLNTVRVPSKRSGGEVDVIRAGSIDKKSFEADKKSQDIKIIDKTIEEKLQAANDRNIDQETRDKLTIDTINTIALNPTEMATADGKIVEEKNMHRVMAEGLNIQYDKAIEKERAKRDPASAGKNIERKIDIDFNEKEFSQFLDEIWPPSAAKPEALNK